MPLPPSPSPFRSVPEEPHPIQAAVGDNVGPLVIFAVCVVGMSVGWEMFAHRLEGRTSRAVSASGEVSRIWGGPLLQPHPQVQWRRADAATVELAQGEIARTDVAVDLDTEYRRRGLVEFPGYKVGFQGSYEFQNPSPDAPAFVGFKVGLPSQQDALMLSDLKLLVDEKEDGEGTEYSPEQVAWTGKVAPGKKVHFKLFYKARGLERFGYTFGAHAASRAQARPVSAFKLAMHVRGARGVLDFPVGSMAPTHQGPAEGGELLVWSVERLLTSFDVGVTLPDNRGLSAALAKLIDNAPFFFLLYGAGLLYALASARRRARSLHVLALSASYFLYFPLATYLTAYLPWPVASAGALVGISLLAIVHAARFVGAQAGARVALCQVFFLAVPAAAYLIPAHTGLILVVAAFLALGVGMHVLGAAARRLKESDEVQAPLPTLAIPAPQAEATP